MFRSFKYHKTRRIQKGIINRIVTTEMFTLKGQSHEIFCIRFFTLFSIFAWPLGIHTITFCISDNSGRIKVWFDDQRRVQTYRGLVYIVVTMVVSTFIYIKYYIAIIYIYIDSHCIYLYVIYYHRVFPYMSYQFIFVTSSNKRNIEF